MPNSTQLNVVGGLKCFNKANGGGDTRSNKQSFNILEWSLSWKNHSMSYVDAETVR